MKPRITVGLSTKLEVAGIAYPFMRRESLRLG
jgi:hypothetical protein